MKKFIFPLVVLLAILGFYVVKPMYMKPSYGRGELAPNIAASTIHGESFDLSTLKGKYVLIDFWGSWCGPCRRENPQVVAFYQKYKNADLLGAQGLEIVSIGVEQKEARWKQAINKDNLNWANHILDKATSLRFFDSPIAKEYGVKEVPTKFLLNPSGEIIGVNLPFEQMAAIMTGKEN